MSSAEILPNLAYLECYRIHSVASRLICYNGPVDQKCSNLHDGEFARSQVRQRWSSHRIVDAKKLDQPVFWNSKHRVVLHKLLDKLQASSIKDLFVNV
jgi:protein gp37